MNMNTTEVLSLDSVLVQREGNIASDMDGEKVMLNVKNGKYYNLGEVGGEIWEALASPVSIRRIAEVMQEIFEVPAELAQQDVTDFVQNLLNEDLVAVVSGP
ncbi:lasso peptide biosynthesis PqqD family chaperone [Paenibacillus tritici]|uniref:Lasso peptide biosynthesis PqqD family chaperone n=1 Tax=Paenibacillus tritici TaxID=1873425 RepID=A0ABX2DUD7_9BACL|nr:lasso peptide biosynthesis PqqD family chaperone [Paenibacillus tritici]NQX48308.1 lasso peptide biosynthesis PqqD family chaperone [Paenibacillus tritici]QUL55755.1 lasso peptide biosynthesis PqqD family chaperone [Paenibacillus tritici]